MSNIHAEHKAVTQASLLDTDELLRNLGRFPEPVLPVGVLRELQSRGDSIHDPLVRLVGNAVNTFGSGVGSITNSVFFSVALLVPIATRDDGPLIESLLTLPDGSLDELIGDLVTEGLPFLIAQFFKEQNASDVIDWIDRLADNPKLASIDASSLFQAMTIAVAQGNIDRSMAIDALVNRLTKRADQRQDLQSAFVVCELMDLGAQKVEGVDSAVRASFERDQIDTSYVGLNSWDEVDLHGTSRRDKRTWIDASEELSRWCYDFVSDDLEPSNATFRVNEQGNRGSHSQESSVPGLIDQVRQSTDRHFPRKAVDSINIDFPDAYHATINLIRDELARYQADSVAWRGNGAYLGLSLTIANRMPLPADLLESILRMPQEDREEVFGDQFGLIVQSTALTPLQQQDFIEQWIWDVDRSNPDRREMVNYYVIACDNGTLNREAAIDKLVSGLRRALLEEPELIAPYAENLAFLTPKEHSHLLDEAFKRNDVVWFIPLQDLRRMTRDAKFAEEQFEENGRNYRKVHKIIEDGVMFDPDVTQHRMPILPRVAQASQQESGNSTTATIRNEVRIQRNDPCPCGSGKKFKKCCINK
jgi:SEC-C motif/Protein of unknown function (DUF1186)